ncbi:19256_t:CDS:1, partial [Funneliformis geosporum]
TLGYGDFEKDFEIEIIWELMLNLNFLEDYCYNEIIMSNWPQEMKLKYTFFVLQTFEPEKRIKYV